jgi:uncharacterized membrane protein (UPF0127 family)
VVRAAFLLLFVSIGSCEKPAGDKPAARPAGTWVILRPEGRPEARVRVKLARTDDERQRGLMFVRELPPDEGMLFLFDHEEIQSFWMKNTLIPLDMIFIDSRLEVVGVVENAKPLTLDARFVLAASRYVLEVNADWAARHGVSAGTRVEFVGVPLD